MNALVTVLDGKGTLTYLGKQYTLHKGDSFIFNKGDQHAVKADKKIKFSLLLWEPAQ